MSSQGIELAKNMQIVPQNQPQNQPLNQSQQMDIVVVDHNEKSPLKTVYSVFHLVVSIFAIYNPRYMHIIHHTIGVPKIIKKSIDTKSQHKFT